MSDWLQDPPPRQERCRITAGAAVEPALATTGLVMVAFIVAGQVTWQVAVAADKLSEISIDVAGSNLTVVRGSEAGR